MKVQAFKALYPNKDLISSPDTFFDAVGRDFPTQYQEGYYNHFDEPAIYIYEITNNNKKCAGIINNTSVHDIIDGKILFHEDTITVKEEDMVTFSLERNAMVKPVLLFHNSSNKLSEFIDIVINSTKPFNRFEFIDGSIHTLWKIKDQNLINQSLNIFKLEIPKAYIADGHHRCSSALKLYVDRINQKDGLSFENMLTAYFDLNQMEIYDHIKIVSILDTLSPESFIAKLSQYASIEQIASFIKPKSKYEFVVIMDKKFYNANWKNELVEGFQAKNIQMSSFISNQIIFKDIFGISDLRTDKRISFFSGKETRERIVNYCFGKPNSIGLCQFPLTIEEIIQIAEAKNNLPPKSTWFEPRIKSGMIAQNY